MRSFFPILCLLGLCCVTASRAEQNLGKLPESLTSDNPAPPVLNSQIADPSALLDPEDGPMVLAKPPDLPKSASPHPSPVSLLPDLKPEAKAAGEKPSPPLLLPPIKPTEVTKAPPTASPPAAPPAAGETAVSLLPPIPAAPATVPATPPPAAPAPIAADMALPVPSLAPAPRAPTPTPTAPAQVAVATPSTPPPAPAARVETVSRALTAETAKPAAPTPAPKPPAAPPAPPAQNPSARLSPPPPLLPPPPSAAETAPVPVPVARGPIAAPDQASDTVFAGPEVAIILSNNRFYPSSIRLKSGSTTRLFFTTVNRRPAALVIERLQIQRWIAKEERPTGGTELDRARWEMNREISSQRVTEILLNPVSGIYTFHDALSGARGEIQVE